MANEKPTITVTIRDAAETTVINNAPPPKPITTNYKKGEKPCLPDAE